MITPYGEAENTPVIKWRILRPDGSVYMQTAFNTEELANDELGRLLKQYAKREDDTPLEGYKVEPVKTYALKKPYNPFITGAKDEEE